MLGWDLRGLLAWLLRLPCEGEVVGGRMKVLDSVDRNLDREMVKIIVLDQSIALPPQSVDFSYLIASSNLSCFLSSTSPSSWV